MAHLVSYTIQIENIAPCITGCSITDVVVSDIQCFTNGTSISEGGLTPDFEVERTIEDFEEDLDPQLDKAIEILLSR